VAFILLVIVFGSAILSGHEKVQIQTITVSGNAAVPTDDILAIANQALTGRYWQLFARSNSLIFPRFEIKNSLLQAIRTIKEVDISWTSWQEINISITERKPHSVWCGDSPAHTEECFFVDKAGYVYAPAPTAFGNLFVRDYGFLTPGDPLGQYYLALGTYVRVFNLIYSLDQNNLKVIAVTYDGFDYRFVLDNKVEIIFNNKNDFDSSFTNLFSALANKSLDLVKDGASISYIDLRFDNKIVIGKKNPIK
jgi:cell division septal protein FtsQ